MAPQPVIAGNWKMFGSRDSVATYAGALRQKLASATPRGALVLCPPATLIAPLAEALADTGVGIGGQDCHAEKNGAHTGDLAAPMVAEAGAGWVIVGHSERRADHRETDAQVAAKAAAAHRAGLIAIVCLGESLEQRKAGEAKRVVATQLAGSLPEGATAINTLIAYEPIWAIGTGLTPSGAEIAEIHAHLRASLAGRVADAAALRLLYGGSVKRANAKEILATPEVNGVLVGGASLDVEEFWDIAQSCP